MPTNRNTESKKQNTKFSFKLNSWTTEQDNNGLTVQKHSQNELITTATSYCQNSTIKCIKWKPSQSVEFYKYSENDSEFSGYGTRTPSGRDKTRSQKNKVQTSRWASVLSGVKF